MQCPVCNVTLQMADRQGIEVDYCPKCRGIWLDRGELEKLMERSAEMESPPPRPFSHDSSYGYGDRDRYRDDDDRDRRYYKKRESWISRLLDFD